MAGFRYAIAAGIVCATLAARAEGPYVNREWRFGFTPPAKWVQKRHVGAVVIFLEPRPTTSAPSPSPGHKETNEEFLARINKTLKTPIEEKPAFQANIVVTARKESNRTLQDYARETRAKAAATK